MTPWRVRPLDRPECPGLPVSSLGLGVLLAQSLDLETTHIHAVISGDAVIYDTQRHYRVPIDRE